jgi:hypothetical protein
MSRRLLVLLAVVCVAALSASAVALARSSSGGDASSKSGTRHHVTRTTVHAKQHHPCRKHRPGDGRMTPGGRATSTPLT